MDTTIELSPKIAKKRVSFAELPTVYSGSSPVHPSVRLSLKRSNSQTDLKKSRIFSVLFMGLFLTLTAYLLYAGFVEKPKQGNHLFPLLILYHYCPSNDCNHRGLYALHLLSYER